LLVGGAGTDTAWYKDSPGHVYINLKVGKAEGGTAAGDALVGIENLIGSDYGDILTGDDGSNVLNGEGGDDILTGHGGTDTLNGSSGDDIVIGGVGADTLNGGSGLDWAQYLNSATGVHVSLSDGTGSGGEAEGDQLTSVEWLSGSDYADMLEGADNAERFYGHDGGDLITGRGGDDWMWGEDGGDALYGDGGMDLINGGNGADYLYGGLNGIFGDALKGGDGADKFVWLSLAEADFDLANLVCSTDNIGDFNRAAGDVIDLSAIDANQTLAGIDGNQAFTFVGTAPFTAPGQISFFIDGGDTYIQLNTDGSDDVDGMIRVVGVHMPDAGWFIL
jgi:Ca2+-binding RTX toxin-like protein